jgi:transposase
MVNLSEAVAGVIGVDTHRDTLTAAVVSPVGGILAQRTVAADAAGYRQLLGFARGCIPGVRCWAVEGAGSYGAGLASFLHQQREWVVEVGRPKRTARRAGAKSDAIDAARAAREALAQERPAPPRRRGDREALRVLLGTRRSATVAKVAAINQLKALIVGAPEELRARLRGLGRHRQVQVCARLRERPGRSLERTTEVESRSLTWLEARGYEVASPASLPSMTTPAETGSKPEGHHVVASATASRRSASSRTASSKSTPRRSAL